MSRFSLLFFSLISLLFTSIAPANTELSQQRILFQHAQKALKTNQINQFNTLKYQLSDYPLHGYLDYLYLRHRLKHTSDSTIINFLNTHDGTFYADRLRSTWLNHLARNKKWSLFLTHYRETDSSSQQCLRLQALIAKGQKQQALSETLALWLVPKSQHKACDPVFKYWQSQNLLTDELRWQRILLALEALQFNLAKYIAKSLTQTNNSSQLISSWRQAHRSPQTLLKKLPATRHSFLSEDTLQNRKLIQYALKRLARKSTDKAFAAWQRIQSVYDFSQRESFTIQASIANRAALNREERALEFFADIPNEPWRARAALWQQNWPAAHKAILSLKPEDQQSTRWQYWLARALEQLGQQQHATEIYQRLISKRDYYGFLAADKLKQPYQMNHNPIIFEAKELTLFKQIPAVARLQEFYAQEIALESRRQAYALQQTMTPRQLQLLAILTHRWGWHSQAIALLGKAQYWDALNLRFPILFDTAILKAGKKYGLNPSWLFAVTRQESAFNPLARSPVGATGLMQLMPRTAKSIARQINKPLKRQSELLNPNRNIQLGTAYLRLMLDKNQHNPVLATASYNAGPHRVARWLPTHSSLPADIWIENIPFTETRRYTRNVLSYAAIFDYQRRQKIKPLIARMPVIQAKKP